MKKGIFITLTFLLPFMAMAQRSEVGIQGGVSFYMGDLNPTSVFKFVQPAGGIFYRYNFTEHWAIRGNAILGWVNANDADSDTPAQRDRNLSFSSQVLEFSLYGELNFFRYTPGDMKHPIAPFIFGGVALFKFNPKAEIDGSQYELQPLGTEGQGTTFYPDLKQYSLTTMSIPFGLGVKANLSKKFSVGLEWGMRYTFTDFLDDVSGVYANPDIVLQERGETASQLSDRSLSGTTNIDRQRGNSKTNDWYSFALLTFSYKIPGRPVKCAAYGE
ncbi:MAG: hypothetical protein ACI97X_001218 [Oceanospirillaceae bacterium]|jgi:hypothetical protein